MVVKKGKGGGAAIMSASTTSVADKYDTGERHKDPGTLNAPYTPKNLQEFLVSFVQEESNLPVCT